MSAIVVLDASVAMSLLREEPTSGAVRAALDRWASDGTLLYVPAPFWTEIVNALTKRHRRPGSEVIEALFELDHLTISSIEIDRSLLLAGLDLVERAGLTIHDAVYLALARSLGGRLATFDHELIAAAGPDGIDMWSLASFGGHRLAEVRAPYGSPERSVTWPSWPGAGSYLATLRRQVLAEG